MTRLGSTHDCGAAGVSWCETQVDLEVLYDMTSWLARSGLPLACYWPAIGQWWGHNNKGKGRCTHSRTPWGFRVQVGPQFGQIMGRRVFCLNSFLEHKQNIAMKSFCSGRSSQSSFLLRREQMRTKFIHGFVSQPARKFGHQRSLQWDFYRRSRKQHNFTVCNSLHNTVSFFFCQ